MCASPTEVPTDPLADLYRRCREPLQERARVWFPTLRGCEEDLYQAAWASLLGSGQSIEDPEKYLEASVYSAGLKELRRRRRRPIVSLSFARLTNGASGRGVWQQGVDALADRTEPLPEEQLESREDARLLAELLDDLSPLQRRIIKLRWGFGLRRREAAALLGVSERTVKREMEKAAPVIARNAELARVGSWCEPKESLVIAYSLGLLGERRGAKAREHLQRCPACRAVARLMRERLEDLAAILPLPALTAASSPEGIVARAAELGDSIRGGLGDLATGVKGHAFAVLSRSPAADTGATQVAAGGGLRGGGSMLASVTACLVAGGGATYCAIEGVPESLRDVAPIERSKDERSAANNGPEQPEQQTPVAQQPAPSAGAPQGDPIEADSTPTEAKPQDPAAEVITEAQPSPTPKGSAEFGKASPSAMRSEAAAAPSSGGGEFTP